MNPEDMRMGDAVAVRVGDRIKVAIVKAVRRKHVELIFDEPPFVRRTDPAQVRLVERVPRAAS